MKIVKYELSLVQKKELILTMEDNVDSENLLKIFLETQVKEEKEQDGLIGIIAEKVSEESCTEQCESCQKYCPAITQVGLVRFKQFTQFFQRKRGVKEYLTYLKLVQYTFIYIAIHLANVCSLSGKLLFPLPLGGLEKQSFLPLGSSGRAFTSQK